jgi:hypothetical protein
MPQLALSVLVSTQDPSQSVKPVWHETAHVPAPSQTSPTAQVESQTPQLRTLLSRSTQTSAHMVCPAAQVGSTTASPPLHADQAIANTRPINAVKKARRMRTSCSIVEISADRAGETSPIVTRRNAH